MSKRRDTPALYELLRNRDPKRPSDPSGSQSGLDRQSNSPQSGGGASAYGKHQPASPTQDDDGNEEGVEEDVEYEEWVEGEDDEYEYEEYEEDVEESDENVSAGSSSSQHQSRRTNIMEEPAGLGRTVRIPFGTVVIALGGMVVLLVIAYSVGFSRGRADTADHESSFFGNSSNTGQSDQGVNLATNDSTGANTRDLNQPPSSEGDPANAGQNLTGGDNTNTRATTTIPARTTDTRTVGLNYIIVEQFSPEEADRAADFLGGQGVDVMVLRTNNPALRQVVVREGFESWGTNSPGRRLLDRLQTVYGVEWRSQHAGSKNFSQAFGLKHR